MEERVLDVVAEVGGLVEGVLYQLETPSEIEKMDVFEHVPTNYSREVVTVDSQGEERAAWTYLANPEVVSSSLKPPCWYLDHLLRGRAYLSDRYIEMLESIECAP